MAGFIVRGTSIEVAARKDQEPAGAFVVTQRLREGFRILGVKVLGLRAKVSHGVSQARRPFGTQTRHVNQGIPWNPNSLFEL